MSRYVLIARLYARCLCTLTIWLLIKYIYRDIEIVFLCNLEQLVLLNMLLLRGDRPIGLVKFQSATSGGITFSQSRLNWLLVPWHNASVRSIMLDTT